MWWAWLLTLIWVLYPACDAEVLAWSPVKACAGGATPSCRTSGACICPQQILFVAPGLYGHAVPLLRLAEEMAHRGHSVIFGTHNELKGTVDAVHGVSFISAGDMPMTQSQLQATLKSISAESSWLRGLLSLFDGVYLPLVGPMFDALSGALNVTIGKKGNTESTGGATATVCLAGDEEECPEGDEGDQRAEEQAGECDLKGKNGTCSGSGAWDHAQESTSKAALLHPALLVIDIAALGVIDLAHSLQVPYMINSPSLLFDLSGAATFGLWGSSQGKGTGAGAGSAAGSGSSTRPLMQRGMRAVTPLLLSAALTGPFMQLNSMRRGKGLAPYHTQEEVLQGARVMVNTASGLDFPRALTPLLAMTGPLLPPSLQRDLEGVVGPVDASAIPSLELPPVISSWLDGGSDLTVSHTKGTTGAQVTDVYQGVVYVSFGHLAHLSSEQINAVLEGLKQLGERLRVLWLVPPEHRAYLPTALPDNFRVKLTEGVPQFGMLAHAATKMVVSSCGMAGAQEALLFGKALLCIPVIAEQGDITFRVVAAGAGLTLAKGTFTPEEVAWAVTELMGNDTYSRAASHVGNSLRLAGGTVRAADLVEGMLASGSDHLHTVDMLIPWHRALNLDLYVLLLAVVFAVVVLAALVCMGLLKLGQMVAGERVEQCSPLFQEDLAADLDRPAKEFYAPDATN
ncbi:unnamed protein product, partial [Chrysoparadoxa australica]